MWVYSHLMTSCLWLSQPLLQLVVAIVVWRRQLHKLFPVFMAFLLIQVGIFAITYPVYALMGSENKWYFGLFWLPRRR